MKHVVYAEKSLLMSDDGADALIEYARMLAEIAQTDTVTVPAVDLDGTVVEATILLTPATHIIVEALPGSRPVPDATRAIDYMRQQTSRRLRPPEAQPETGEDVSRYDDAS